MIAIVQRVSQARVIVDQQTVGSIGVGLLVLAAVEAADTPADVDWMAAKLLGLRIFRHGEKHFDRDLLQADAAPGILLVSNFTVAADTSTGRRPSLSRAAPPAMGRDLFDQFVAAVRRQAPPQVRVETGQFGADMRVELANDGPATFILESPKP